MSDKNLHEPLLKDSQDLQQHPSAITSYDYDDVLIGYYKFSSTAHAALERFSNCFKQLCIDDIAKLDFVLEKQLLDQSAFASIDEFLFRIFESSQVTVSRLMTTMAEDDRYRELRQSITDLFRVTRSDSLRRYLQPGSFVTAQTLTRDLHCSLLLSNFDLFNSDTFQPRRHLVDGYIEKMGDADRGNVIRGYSGLLQLAGLTQLDQYRTTSEILRTALDRVRDRRIEEVLRSILEPRDGFQLLRLGQLIAFCLGQPALTAEPSPPGFIRSFLRGLMQQCNPANNARMTGVGPSSVAMQFVLRLRSSVLVVDEYPGGQPSTNLSRLICMFQQDRAEAVNLADYQVYVAPYCADECTRAQHFGSDENLMTLFANEQLNNPSVRAVVFFIGADMAAKLDQSSSLESRMLKACFGQPRCEVLMLMDEGVDLTEKAQSRVNWQQANRFVLSVPDDEIEWRNFLVRLANLPGPPLPPQTPMFDQPESVNSVSVVAHGLLVRDGPRGHGRQQTPAPNQQRLSALLPLPSRWSQLSSSATRQFRMSFKPRLLNTLRICLVQASCRDSWLFLFAA
uniref:TIR domain-containing protein n=1 Tax=Macrostomum lignano TaxID=282301 RepID=A0A1I8G9I5_9PLAT